MVSRMLTSHPQWGDSHITMNGGAYRTFSKIESCLIGSHQCGLGLNPGLSIVIMWIEFVVGSRPCS